MKKSWMIALIVIAVILLICQFFVGIYNQMVRYNGGVNAAWSMVETQYQRRGDLIDNLVNTVKGYADFEKSTLNSVVEARAKATSVNINANALTPEAIAQYQSAQNQLSSSLSRLLVSVEAYPNLKANEGFLKLQDELAGTENRIAVARDNFNEAVRIYNTYIQMFPKKLLAGLYGFHPQGYFTADPGKSKVPTVKF